MKKEKISFEEALAKLEEAVARLEEENLPLQEALRAYEEAVGMVTHCQTLLTAFEGRVRILKDAASLQEEDFSAETTGAL